MFFPLRDINPTVRRPVMTWTLIAITSVVFLFEFTVHPDHLRELAYLFGIVPARYSIPDWAIRVGFPIDDYWPFLTSMFLHAGFHPHSGQHVGLVDFWRQRRRSNGTISLSSVYVLCGITAGLVFSRTAAR